MRQSVSITCTNLAVRFILFYLYYYHFYLLFGVCVCSEHNSRITYSFLWHFVVIPLCCWLLLISFWVFTCNLENNFLNRSLFLASLNLIYSPETWNKTMCYWHSFNIVVHKIHKCLAWEMIVSDCLLCDDVSKTSLIPTDTFIP